jgi:hypothetical protein
VWFNFDHISRILAGINGLSWKEPQMNRSQFAAFLVIALLLVGHSHLRADYSITDLVDAAKRGDEHAVHFLIEQGADLDARDPVHYTALHWAAIRGHWRILSKLVEAGAPVDAVGFDGGTPLFGACHHDNPDAVRELIDAGADVGVQYQWGRTPLHVAARRGCLEVAELLLDAGADPNATTKEGWTPMHVAAMSGDNAMIDLLETRGGDPTRKDTDGRTACQRWTRRLSAIDVASSKQSEYAGIYDLGRGFSFKVWLAGDTLRIQEFAPDDLVPVGSDAFQCRREPWKVRFVRTDDGDIDLIEVDFLRRTVRGTRTNAPRYVGSQVCMDCHSAADGSGQNVQWMRSRHAHAYWRLGSDWSLFLARLRPHYQDLENPIADDRCLLCHTTAAQEPEALFDSSFRPQEGVSCEACHGPGSNYAEVEVMADREAFVANGGRIPDEATCRSCHRRSENFGWAEKWPMIAHPKPSAIEENEPSAEGSSDS